MEITNATDSLVKKLLLDIHYLHKALNVCDDTFAYKTDIKSCLAETYAQLGHLFYKNNHFDEAIKNYLKAIKFNQLHFQALHQIGLTLTKQGFFEEARLYFQRICNSTSTSKDLIHKVDALLHIGHTYLLENKYQSLRKALKYINKSEELLPGYKLTKYLQDNIQISIHLKSANNYIENKQWFDAYKSIKLAKAINPFSNDILVLEDRLKNLTANYAYSKSKNKSIFIAESDAKENYGSAKLELDVVI